MKAFIPDYKIESVRTLGQLLEVMQKGPVKPVAGGTDVMVLLESGKLPAGHYVDIGRVSELRFIDYYEDRVEIGALTTYMEIMLDALMQKEFPLLVEAARLTGAVAIQNRGTLGGNIVNASPAADTPPALLCYDAEVELVSKSSARRVPYTQLHLGYRRIDIQPDEILKKIIIKRNTIGTQQFYRKVGTRKSQAISKLCFASLVRRDATQIHDIRIGLGSLGPTPLRALQTEKILQGVALTSQLIDQACATLKSELHPIDDVRSTALYRREVAANILRQLLEAL